MDKVIFTETEQSDFDLVRDVRHRIIKEYTEDELPGSFDMDRLISVTKHLEEGAMAMAKIRIKQQEADGKDANTALLAEYINQMRDSGGITLVGQAKIVDDAEYELPKELEVEPVEGGLRQGDRNPDLYDEIFGGST